MEVAVQKKPPEHRQRVLRPPGARRAQRAPKVEAGERFGELTVGKFLWVHPTRGHAWLLRCDCGRLAIRHTGQLLQSRREGTSPMCLTCLHELVRGYAIDKSQRIHAETHQYFLLLWEASGSLYSEAWDRRLRAALRDELELPDPEWQLPDQIETFGPESDPERYARASRTNARYFDLPEMTLEEIGKVFGVKRERIRQIETRALRKLRHPSRSVALEPFLFDSTSENELARMRALAVEKACETIEKQDTEKWERRSRWICALQYKVRELLGSRVAERLPVTVRRFINYQWSNPEFRYVRAIGSVGRGIVVQLGHRAIVLHSRSERRYIGEAQAENGSVLLKVVLQL